MPIEPPQTKSESASPSPAHPHHGRAGRPQTPSTLGMDAGVAQACLGEEAIILSGKTLLSLLSSETLDRCTATASAPPPPPPLIR